MLNQRLFNVGPISYIQRRALGGYSNVIVVSEPTRGCGSCCASGPYRWLLPRSCQHLVRSCPNTHSRCLLATRETGFDSGGQAIYKPSWCCLHTGSLSRPLSGRRRALEMYTLVNPQRLLLTSPSGPRRRSSRAGWLNSLTEPVPQNWYLYMLYGSSW